jgi:hypothetical protein
MKKSSFPVFGWKVKKVKRWLKNGKMSWNNIRQGLPGKNNLQ